MTHPLTSWRQDRGVTLTELARRVPMSKGYLSTIESGASCSMDIAHRLQVATGGQVTMEAIYAAQRPRTRVKRIKRGGRRKRVAAEPVT